jgi:dihydroflavonol-4-reductase
MLTLVTGASGHLGATLVRHLLARGHRVRALIHSHSVSLEGLPIERVRGDILDRASLDPAFDGVEAVFHLAAAVSLYKADAERVTRINTLGPEHVVDACLAHKVRRLVHYSSVHAFLPHEPGGVTDETRPPNFARRAPAYDRSKARGQQIVQEAVRTRGLDAVVVNPVGVLGPWDFAPYLGNRAILDLGLGVLPALVRGGFDWVDSRDVSDGAIAALERGRAGESYLLSGTWRAATDLAALVEQATGTRRPRFTAPLWLARIGVPFAALYAKLRRTRPLFTMASLRALTEHRNVTSEKARAELGYAPRPLAETVRDSFTFFRAVGLFERGAREGRPHPGELPSGAP